MRSGPRHWICRETYFTCISSPTPFPLSFSAPLAEGQAEDTQPERFRPSSASGGWSLRPGFNPPTRYPARYSTGVAKGSTRHTPALPDAAPASAQAGRALFLSLNKTRRVCTVNHYGQNTILSESPTFMLHCAVLFGIVLMYQDLTTWFITW